MKTLIPSLELPLYMRKILSIPLATLYVSDKNLSIPGIDIGVGDIVSYNLSPKKSIIDGKTLRTKTTTSGRGAGCKAINIRGTVSLNAITMLKIKNIERLFIEGEEDLVLLGASREHAYGTKIAYGQPGAGIVVLKNDPFYTINIIKTFKPVIYEYKICDKKRQ